VPDDAVRSGGLRIDRKPITGDRRRLRRISLVACVRARGLSIISYGAGREEMDKMKKIAALESDFNAELAIISRGCTHANDNRNSNYHQSQSRLPLLTAIFDPQLNSCQSARSNDLFLHTAVSPQCPVFLSLSLSLLCRLARMRMIALPI